MANIKLNLVDFDSSVLHVTVYVPMLPVIGENSSFVIAHLDGYLEFFLYEYREHFFDFEDGPDSNLVLTSIDVLVRESGENPVPYRPGGRT
jgi:hypothetical protein